MELKEELYKLLHEDTRIWSDKILNKTLLFDLIDNYDEKLYRLLFSNKNIVEHFCKKIDDNYELNIKELKIFIEQNKIYNSFTTFENRIGLSNGKEFIMDSGDVVINFPYKDCVFEGDQRKDSNIEPAYILNSNTKTIEKTQEKRKEIFFNNIIEKDQQDRLLDNKALTGWKRYTKDGIEDIESFERNAEGKINENLIIKGNNLLILHSLKQEFSGRIKMIFIDPPYNTGSDEFQYNDNYNHSTWLTFMKNRLEVARDLLAPDGSIYISIDFNEVHYLKVLMDEIFKRDNFEKEIIWRMGFLSGYKTNEVNYIRNHDTILYYSKNHSQKYFNKEASYIYNKDFAPILKESKELNNFFKSKGLSEEQIKEIYEYVNHTSRSERYPFEDTFNSSKWDEGEMNSLAIDNATKVLEETVQIDGKSYKGQKPEKLIKRLIETSTKEGDYVLDFFAGTGTTAATAHKLNRKYIVCEQIDSVMEKGILPRMRKVLAGGKEGISEKINWKGGGNFIYCELAKCNERARELINQMKSYNELVAYFEELCNKYYLNYNLNISDFSKNVINSNEFKNLSLEEQKHIFVDMLDVNQMYIRASECKDKKFKMSDKDILLNQEFYKE